MYNMRNLMLVWSATKTLEVQLDCASAKMLRSVYELILLLTAEVFEILSRYVIYLLVNLYFHFGVFRVLQDICLTRLLVQIT